MVFNMWFSSIASSISWWNLISLAHVDDPLKVGLNVKGVGCSEGCLLGKLVGCPVGCAEGFLLGFVVGESDGSSVTNEGSLLGILV